MREDTFNLAEFEPVNELLEIEGGSARPFFLWVPHQMAHSAASVENPTKTAPVCSDFNCDDGCCTA